MATERQRISSIIRDTSPCAGCTEKFRACHDRCPKDERGEPGYNAWKAKINQVKKTKQQYLDNLYVRQKKHNGGYHGEK